jgi:hypothetical protein
MIRSSSRYRRPRDAAREDVTYRENAHAHAWRVITSPRIRWFEPPSRRGTPNNEENLEFSGCLALCGGLAVRSTREAQTRGIVINPQLPACLSIFFA